MRFFLSSVMVFAAVSGVFAQTRTVTNSDLEKFRVEREAADRALRERYKRLGLPSPEEIQKETERRNAEFIRYSQQLRAERVDAENGIIARANFLRSQIAALDAQIDYLRSGASGSVYRGGQSVGYGFYGYYGGGRYRAYQSSDELRRISQLPPNMRTAAEYALSFRLRRASAGRRRRGFASRLRAVTAAVMESLRSLFTRISRRTIRRAHWSISKRSALASCRNGAPSKKKPVAPGSDWTDGPARLL